MLIRDLSNSFNPVPKPGKTIKKEPQKIKNKSKKLAKLEKNRFSIITNNLEKCYFCENDKMDLHEIFRGRNRQKSIKWGLVIPMCRKHHKKATEEKEFSRVIEEIAKKKFIKLYGEEKFIQEFK